MPVQRNGMGNLRGYLQEAVLPPMRIHHSAPRLPPAGHKSHLNHLKIRSEPYRRLETIVKVPPEVSDPPVLNWVKKYIPGERLPIPDQDPASGEYLSMPCPPLFEIQSPPGFTQPDNIRRMQLWLEGYPLMTAQRILHAVFPETSGWEFVLGEPETQDPDRALFGYFQWMYRGKSLYQKKDDDFSSVVIAYQPPWILSNKDLEEFASCRSFPAHETFGSMAPPPQLESKHRLWAKIWDTCVRCKSSYFVLTSYNSWTFGEFTEGWSKAYVNEPMAFNLQSPTVLETFIYSIAAASGFRGTQRHLQVPEPVENLKSAFSMIHIPEEQPRYPGMGISPVSESNWDGKSSAAGTSAGAYSNVSPVMSSMGLPGEGPLPTRTFTANGPLTAEHRRKLEKWASVAAHHSDRGKKKKHPLATDSDSWSSVSSRTKAFVPEKRKRDSLSPVLEDVTDRFATGGDWLG